MCTKKFLKVFGLFLVVGLLFAVAPTKQAQAAATVSDETELLAALADSETTIELDASFSLSDTVYVSRPVTIDGKNFTITGPSTAGKHGIVVSANGVTIQNLTITASTKTNLQFYRVTGGVVTNVVLSNAGNAGMIVNGSQVTISNVTTTNNAWGGINVDQGVGVTEIPLLTVTNVTTHTSPAGTTTAAIWVDKGNAAWVAVGDLYTVVAPPNGYLVFYDNTEFATIAANFPIHNENLDIYYATIQEAINAATPGDTITVNGTHVLTSVVNVNKAVTLTCATGAKIQVSGTGDRFDVSAAATIQNCEIEKTDEVGQQDIIRLRASGITIKDNTIWGYWDKDDPYYVSRAMIFNAGGFSDILITGNEIYGLRQPAYISGTHTGTISNNYVHGTKGWVLEGGNLTFTGNTWADNVGDIAILSTVPSQYYTDILALSAANDNAVVEDQRVTPAVLSVAYVDDSAAAGGNGTEASPYQSIQAGINRVIAGGTVNVAAGTYKENLQINKAVNLLGLQNTRTFDSVVIGEQAPNVWYVDRYAPAVFESFDFEGRKVLRHGVSASDFQSSSFYNYQGRKLDVNLTGPTITVSIDLFVGSDWGSTSRNAGFWATGLDSSNAISAYPMIAWRSGGTDPAGFYAFDYFSGGWLKLKEASSEDYGKWHNLAFTYNVGEGVSYFIDGAFSGSFADSYTAQIANIILNVYNCGTEYEVYWDNLTNFTNEAKVTGLVNILAADVVVDGFTLENPGQSIAVDINSTATNVALKHNVIQNVGGSSVGQMQAVYLEHGPDNVLIEGNTFKDISSGISSAKAILSGDSNTNDAAEQLIIRANTFSNISASRGAYGVILNNGEGNPGAIIEANAFNGLSGAWTHAIGLEGPTENAKVENNAFAGLTATSPDNSAIFFEDNSGGGSVAVKYNKFFHSGLGVGIHLDDQPGGANNFNYTVDASPNWWGSVSGPVVSTQIFGSVTYDPWCGDAECSFLNPNYLRSGVTSAEIQAAINNAHAGEIIVIPAGTYNQSGGFTIGKPGVTIRLKSGAIIKNSYPCFIVNADNVMITSETIGGAVCMPTNGSDGIVVNAGVSGVRIVGLEIDGKDQETGDGIHFAGAITNFQIVNNFIHDLDGDGVEFTVQPTGEVMEIQGNLFQNNGGLGVNAGTFEVNAEYNSWGDIDGPEAGDGISENVDADPWTHVDLYMTAAPWADKAANGKQFTVTVKANLKNVYGASFKLNYDKTSLNYISVAEGTAFDPVPEHTTRVTVNENTGVITYDGAKTGGVSGPNVVLFTLTFEALDNGEATLTFDTATDLFAMSYPITSSNIYAANLEDLSLDLFDLPTIDSANIQGYYLSGEERQFSVVLTNPENGSNFAHVYVDFTIADAQVEQIEKIEYSVDNGAIWVPLGEGPGTNYGNVGSNIVGYFGKITGGGFPLAPDTTPTTLFRVTFAQRERGETDYPTSYSITMRLKDADTADPDTELAAFTKTAYVYDKPEITTSNMGGPYLVGIAQDFKLTVTNSSAIPAPFELVFNFPEGTTLRYSGTDYGCTGGVCTIPVTIPNASNELTFTATFAAAMSGDITVTLKDSDWLPTHRDLASLTQGVVVYANYTVSGTFSMQGRIFRGGIPVTLTSTTVGFPYGPWTVNSTDNLGVNWVKNNVALSEYLITTNQPRYLNLTTASAKSIYVDGPKTLNALMLRGGNVVNAGTSLDTIDVSDAGLIGGVYGISGDPAEIDADANFDGRVNILDLALVGGNFGMTSADYDWSPVTLP